MLNKNDVVAQVEEYMNAMMALSKFSGSVLLAHDQQILHCAGYGFSDWEHDVRNIPRTKFRIGSITKQFTALAILLLEEEGKLSVHDPITKHLPYSLDRWNDVKIRHLLNHTSGIPSLTEFVEQETTARLPLPLTEWIEMFKDKPLQFEPGSQYHYSNSGYLLLGDIIERASSATYEKFLETRIFEPLKMSDSGYDQFSKILPHRASGYRKHNNRYVRAPYVDMGFPFAAGALYSTVEDLYRWDQALLGEHLVSRETIAKMTAATPFVAAYGYGTVVGRMYNRRTLGHAGGINGFRANMVRFPDEPACVIVLSNSESSDFFGVTNTLSAILFGENYQMPLVPNPMDVALASSYAGTYEIAPGMVLEVRGDDNRLIVTTDDVERHFFAKSETSFIGTDSKDTINFHLSDDSDQSYMIVQHDDIEMTARKVARAC